MYKEPFYLTERSGNNAFAWDERGPEPRLWVPACREGELSDLKLGTEVAFSDLEDEGVLQSCSGLQQLLKTSWNGVPTVIVDNHNHVFYFWYEALEKGRIPHGLPLLHVDQHKDMRPAPEPYVHSGLESAFHYTNQVLNVGNYIRPAMDEGLISEVHLVTGSAGLDLPLLDSPFLLNIDLDLFVPELEIDRRRAFEFIRAQQKRAALITIATSPFFMDQSFALELLHELLEG